MSELCAQEFCRVLLTSGDLASKLRPPRSSDGKLLPLRLDYPALHIESPARDVELRLDKVGERLPPLRALVQRQARVKCLQRFAHHELQAIELFAWAVLRFPQLHAALRRGFLLVLEEEQQHLQLYLTRLHAHGARLQDGPLSDYLWQHLGRIESSSDPPLSFLCSLGLTFEQANLDFAQIYRDAFAAAGDKETAAVLQRVHDDEIRHVRLAVRWLRRLKAPGESDLAAYQRAVPFPLSAARAKGRRFDLASRRQAGLDDELIAHVAAAEPYRRPSIDRHPKSALWLLPNLGAEEAQAVPAGARGFLRGLYGAWAALFDGRDGLPWLMPPGDNEAQGAWRTALMAKGPESGPALSCLNELLPAGGLLAWLNTAEAEKTAHAHRLSLVGPPPASVFFVHDKAYALWQCEALGLDPDCLRGLGAVFSAAECQDAERARARLASFVAGFPEWTGRRFVLKPRLGTSGRGRFIGRLVDEGGGGAFAPPLPESTWSLLARREGCIVEPWLDRLCDLSTQMMVRKGGVEVLGTTLQLLTPSGQIRGNRGILDDTGTLRAGVELELEAELAAAAQRLGAAAAAAGFYGIAGVDAFVFRGPHGQPVLRSVVELNARFTTGTVALGLCRRLEAQKQLGRPGAWALVLKAPPREQLEGKKGLSFLCPLPRGPALLYAASADALDGF